MQNLPTAEVYEKEFTYMPWGILINEVFEIIQKIPEKSEVLDLMCGPGYLLGKLQSVRPDLILTGVDFEKEFIQFAEQKYPNISFVHGDARVWESDKKFDLILVTAGIHHIPFADQEIFLKKVASLSKPNGKAIIGDPYIDSSSSEQERKLAGAKLGYEYLAATIKNGGTDDVIKAAIDVLSNDVLLVEYKNSIKQMKPLMEKYFSKIEMHKTWPKEDTEYGDYYFILSN